MSTEDEHCSGNLGFKDQQMMLEWVQMNIEKFNGDGHSVTLFGNSAGGASVNYHMFSSLSRGLFHRAISQSGNVMEPWASPARKGVAKMRAIRLADMMNCPISGTSMKDIVECLRKVPAANITMALANFIVDTYKLISL
jgi:acetylcholinesterase